MCVLLAMITFWLAWLLSDQFEHNVDDHNNLCIYDSSTPH